MSDDTGLSLCVPVSYPPIKLLYIPVTAKWNSLNSMVLLKYGLGANVKLILYPDLISSNSSTSNWKDVEYWKFYKHNN